MTGTEPAPMTPTGVTCALSRRTLLGGAGALGAAFVLAACEAVTPAAPSTPPTTAPPPPTGPPKPTGPAGALIALDEVPVGGGAIAPGPMLVVQLKAGEVKAYDAVCPHMRITVGTPDGSGTIICPGHGARFAAVDGGLLAGPAPTGLRAVEVAVNEGFVVRV